MLIVKKVKCVDGFFDDLIRKTNPAILQCYTNIVVLKLNMILA